MAPTINAADTAWLLVATALVLVMTPALGLFYGGTVRAKDALNTLMMSFSALGFVGIAGALLTGVFVESVERGRQRRAAARHRAAAHSSTVSSRRSSSSKCSAS